MVRIQSELKRAFLRQLAEGAKATASTLGEALLAYQSQLFSASFKSGRIYISTSGSGQSASFAAPQAGIQVKQEDLVALSEELLSVLSDTVARGFVDDTSATDALFQAMCDDDRCRGVRTRGLDVTLIGLPIMGSSLRS